MVSTSVQLMMPPFFTQQPAAPCLDHFKAGIFPTTLLHWSYYGSLNKELTFRWWLMCLFKNLTTSTARLDLNFISVFGAPSKTHPYCFFPSFHTSSGLTPFMMTSPIYTDDARRTEGVSASCWTSGHTAVRHFASSMSYSAATPVSGSSTVGGVFSVMR